MANPHESCVFLSRENDFDDVFKKGQQDKIKYKEKLKKVVRENLGDLVGDESIVTNDGKKVIKVPIKSIQIPRFKFNEKNGGEGEGDGPGNGKQAGDEAGEDYLEAAIDMSEIEEMVFAEMGLPWLTPKGKKIESQITRFDDVAKKGLMPNVDKKRTIRENILRNARNGNPPKVKGIRPEDIRYRVSSTITAPESSAVIIAMRDVSGSMGEFEKYISRTAYKWMLRFLRKNYKNVETCFITHHTEAHETNENDFFYLGESGGTMVSSAYKLANELIDKRYPPSEYNIYPYHFSDGDNWGGDNMTCLELINTLLTKCNMFGYAEIRQGGYGSISTLMNTYEQIKSEKFISSTITDPSEILPTLRKFFPKNDPEGGVSRL